MGNTQYTKQQKKEMDKRIARVKEMRTKCKEEIYPIALDIDKSIEDTKTFISVLAMTIRQAFINEMKTTKVGELSLIDKLDKNAPNYNDIIRLINVMAEETITDSCEMLEGFPQAIDAIIKRESMSRPFKDLLIEWDKV